MDVYKTEEEQVQAIKQWWKDNAVSVIAGIVIGVAVLGGYRYWSGYQQAQSQQASIIYNEVLSAKDKSKNAEILMADYSGTPYAALAALLVARDNLNAKEIEKAISQLKWVIDNSGNEGVQNIAIQRLARLYLSQDSIESAEALVKGVKAEGFTAMYSEIRGDINLAKKLPVQAKENYRIALAALSPNNQRYPIIKMKLDDLSVTTLNGVKSK